MVHQTVATHTPATTTHTTTPPHRSDQFKRLRSRDLIRES
jgi:hypothetical protein